MVLKRTPLSLLCVVIFSLMKMTPTFALGMFNQAPNLKIDPQSITISGLSSGAFMAKQMLVAYSSVISGAALFAGGPFYCAEALAAKAITQCMNNPQFLDVDRLAQATETFATQGQIDSTRNLGRSRVFLFSGAMDSIVKSAATQKSAELLKKWVPAAQIQTATHPTAEHGIPTKDFGVNCSTVAKPYLNNCKMDGVGAGLQHLYGASLHPPRPLTPAEKNLLTLFDQRPLGDDTAVLYPQGWIFVPNECAAGKGPCRLHIALHGCDQNTEAVNRTFAENAGYLEWAVANHIVVVFPQARKSDRNPKGCWDWFGYTGPDYAVQKGPQMKAIRTLIRAISGH